MQSDSFGCNIIGLVSNSHHPPCRLDRAEGNNSCVPVSLIASVNELINQSINKSVTSDTFIMSSPMK